MPPVDLKAICLALDPRQRSVAQCKEVLQTDFSLSLARLECPAGNDYVARQVEYLRGEAVARSRSGLLKDAIVNRWKQIGLLRAATAAEIRSAKPGQCSVRPSSTDEDYRLPKDAMQRQPTSPDPSSPDSSAEGVNFFVGTALKLHFGK
ncbi:MAG: hypothetical protein HY696_11705 [Deltaproteobacteria bacterium]|nr:hypothetical protein [Deltaproteobacteria bacterium]